MLATSAVGAAHLTKRFEETTAVDDVSLAVAAGEIRGLLGPNGAGKTTLLRMLLGLVHPDAGTIELLGRPLAGAGSAALDHVAGFVEEPSFYPYLSGRANLAALAALDGTPADAAGPAVAEALERVGLADRGGTRVGGYSTGMRQRLGIAAALLRSPRALLLDEPTSGLDPGGSRAVAGLLRELARDGVAILVSSHQVGELEVVCDAYTFLRAGRVVWDGDRSALEAAAPAGRSLLATSDDARALALAAHRPGVSASRGDGAGLAVTSGGDELDAFVIALGSAGVAVRRLEPALSPLQRMFFHLAPDAEPR